MRIKTIIVSAIFFIIGCVEQKVDYLNMGKDILSTNTMDKTELLRAIEYFNSELKINPNSVETLKNLAIAYSKINDEEKSYNILSKAIDQNNIIAEELYTIRGLQYFANNKYEESILNFQEALKLNPANQNIYKLIFTSKLWQKYKKNGAWESFDKSDVQFLIDEVYGESSVKPTYEELIALSNQAK